MRKYLYIIVLVPITGCFNPPQQHKIINTMVIPKPYEEVWTKCVQWFALNNTPIKTIDKTSGIIAAERNLRADDNLCDCGYIKRLADKEIIAKVYAKYTNATYNIFIQKIDEKSVQITINTQYNCKQRLYSLTGALAESRDIECTSLGTLEKAIINYIDPTIKIDLPDNQEATKNQEELK